MLDVLADNPVLTLFLVVGLGLALGLVPWPMGRLSLFWMTWSGTVPP
jgi:hypothetical protein